ncbi:MAG TPA: LCP family protein [Candidatus Limnocylindria bacterium]|nr:LCP family protein [Candidatus Limnocylindria bacterium]
MSRRTALLVGAVIVVVFGAIGFLLFAGGEPPPPEPSRTPTPTVEPTPSPSVEAFNEELLNQRLTVLLVGLDMNEARRQPGIVGNTDVLMLASVSADQSDVVLVSLPRDTVDVPLADGSIWRPKINGLFAERGIDTLVGAMETLYGVPIDGYVIIDMEDFPVLVDAADGVTVNPPAPIVDPPIGLNIQPGEQVIDGATALSYVRSRLDQDYGRMGRQQEVITDLVARLVDSETDINLGELLTGLDSIETDLPLEDLRTLAEIARRAQEASVQRVLVDPPDLIVREGDLGDGRGYVLVPDIEAIRNTVIALIPPEE